MKKLRFLQNDKDTTKMNILTKYGYGTGHIINDMSGSLWFSLLLLFYLDVIKIGPISAGIIMSVGQIASGVSTVVIGVLIEKKIPSFSLWISYGKRKSWHFLATVGVLLTFPFLFAPAIGLSKSDVDCSNNETCNANVNMTVYYSVIAVLYNCFWAILEVSHLAMIPGIASCEKERGALSTIRTVGNVVSNIIIYIVLLMMFRSGGNGTNEIGPKDADIFRKVTMICVVGIGVLSSVIYHVAVKSPGYKPMLKEALTNVEKLSVQSISKQISIESQVSTTSSNSQMLPDAAPTMAIHNYCLEPQFYLIACVYMATKVFVNVSMSYMPLYIQHTLHLENIYVALIPLVMYVTGFIVSITLRFLTRRVGFMLVFAISCGIGVCGCLWIWFGCNESTAKYEIFVVAGLIGSGGAAMTISSLTLLTTYATKDPESSSFVFGAMCFADKVSCGVAFMIIQNNSPVKLDPCEINCDFFEYVLVCTCGFTSVVGLIMIVLLYPMKIGKGRKLRGGIGKIDISWIWTEKFGTNSNRRLSMRRRTLHALNHLRRRTISVN